MTVPSSSFSAYPILLARRPLAFVTTLDACVDAVLAFGPVDKSTISVALVSSVPLILRLKSEIMNSVLSACVAGKGFETSTTAREGRVAGAFAVSGLTSCRAASGASGPRYMNVLLNLPITDCPDNAVLQIAPADTRLRINAKANDFFVRPPFVVPHILQQIRKARQQTISPIKNGNNRMIGQLAISREYRFSTSRNRSFVSRLTVSKSRFF